MRIKVQFLRYGRVGGKNCRFTHHDPATNSYWTDDLSSGSGADKVWGMWVKADSIKWEGR